MLRAVLITTALFATAAVAQDITRQQVVRPEGTRPAMLPQAEAVAMGERLFNATSVSTNGNACATCHAGLQNFNETFRAPYPHFVQMAKDTVGLDVASIETMIQICMLAPMAAQPLAWDSRELTALSAYMETVRQDFARK